MKFPRTIFALLMRAAIVAALAGCTHLATFHEKEISFQRFESLSLDGVPLSNYLQARSGVLIAGAKPVVIGGKPPGADIRLEPIAADGFDIGSVTAVTRDGYYLTAGHCVLRRPLYVMLASEAGAKIRSARLVWSPPANSSCDLAVLKIDPDSPAAFSEIDPRQIQPGLDVVTSGANGLAGGKVVQMTAVLVPAGKGWPATLAIIHSAPLAQGDSGGPLIALNGKLVGIEVLARGVFLGTTEGIALRPDPAWLDQTIARDRATHPPAGHPSTRP